jgi:PAT family beta-lactamase induction signal transducer AmpG
VGIQPTPDAPVQASRRGRTLWVSTTYFAEGLPYSIVRFLATVYLTDIGAKESLIGFLNFLGLPWNLKFLWAPAVDLFSTRRRWLIRIQALVAVGVALLGLLSVWGPPTGPVLTAMHAYTAMAHVEVTLPGMDAVRAMLVVLIGLAFLSATHDIAIDAFYMEAIPDGAEAAAYTGLRNVTYRLAVLFVKSGLVWLTGVCTWAWGFGGGAIALGLLVLVHMAILPHPPSRPRHQGGLRTTWAAFGEALGSFLRTRQIGLVLTFIITYKLGDELLFAMNTTFLKREIGVRNEDLSWIAGLVGTWAAIGGSLVSAWAIQRFGLRRAVWPLTLGMNLNIWVYVWLAWTRPDPHTAAGLTTVAIVHAYEQIAAGLGNAVLVVYIMRICDPRFKAAHYAIGSAIASLGGSLFGGFAGKLVEQIGYVNLFMLAFGCAVPSMLVLLKLEIPEERAALPT